MILYNNTQIYNIFFISITKEIIINNNTFGAVEKFRYLGAILSSDSRIQDDVNTRIKTENSHFCSIKSF